MQFALEHYNYWIIILLMMGGLYIVFESQNLIKRLVGLSIFQTSVIVFYVTLGKVAGGTAPIFVDTGHHGDDHGGGHGDAAGHAVEAAAGTSHDGHSDGHHDDAHDADSHASDAHHDDSASHDVVEGPTHHGADAAEAHQVGHDGSHAVDGHEETAAHGADAAHAAAEVLYSNPLPHVLMLTAIVVGVATLSVGLALVVRIREAYGTIEMDDVNSADMAASELEGEKA